MTVVSENEFGYRQSTHTSMVHSLPGEALTGSVFSVSFRLSFHAVLPHEELLNPQSPPDPSSGQSNDTEPSSRGSGSAI